MARNKLIAKYAALNNEKLPQRIYDKIKSFIESEGIEELHFRELSGRWTGKLDISNGGWRNDFDLLCPVLAMCRVNRHGEVLPDMAKINACVQEWVNFLTMPTEDDEYLGASDETFSDSDYLPDDINEFQSAAYEAEIKSFLNSEEKDFLQHDKALSEIDAIGCAETDDEESDGQFFEQGFNVTRIDNAEDFKKIWNLSSRKPPKVKAYPGFLPNSIWRNSKNYLRGKKNLTKAGWILSMTYATGDSETFRKITMDLLHPMTSSPT